MSHTLRFPVRLAPGWTISGAESWSSADLLGLEFRVRLENRHLVVVVDGFATDEQARDYLPRLRAALYWVALDRKLAFKARLELGPVVRVADPESLARTISRSRDTPVGRLDGLVIGNYPCTFPSESRLGLMTANDPDVEISLPPKQFFDALEVGLRSADPICLDDERVETALSLYCAEFYEHSDNAKLLVLVMALECLAKRGEKPQLALNLLAKWRQETLHLRHQLDEASEEHEALESLERELLFRKEASLRSSVRLLVHGTLQAAGHPDALELARCAADVYDARSSLVHDGRLPQVRLSRALADARKIVTAVLKVKILGADSCTSKGSTAYKPE